MLSLPADYETYGMVCTLFRVRLADREHVAGWQNVAYILQIKVDASVVDR